MSHYRAYFVPGAVDPLGLDVITDFSSGGGTALDVLSTPPFCDPMTIISHKKYYKWKERHRVPLLKESFFPVTYLGRSKYYETYEDRKVEMISDFLIAGRTINKTELVLSGSSHPRNAPIHKIDNGDSTNILLHASVDVGWKIPTTSLLQPHKGRLAGQKDCQKEYLLGRSCEGGKMKYFKLPLYGQIEKNDGFGGGLFCNVMPAFKKAVSQFSEVDICSHPDSINEVPKGYEAIDGEFSEVVHPNLIELAPGQ